MRFHFAFIFLVNFLIAGGITADAGLTPPLDRFIFRVQMRTMNMTSMGMDHTVKAFPIVAAYGLKPGMAVIGRVLFKNTYSKNMNSNTENFMFLVKPRLYRINTPLYTVGASGSLGSIYEKGIGASIVAGLQGSLRQGFLAVDLNLESGYTFSSGNFNTSINTAVGWLTPLNRSRNMAVSPVIESLISTENSRNRVVLSPGAKMTVSSFIIETLYNFTVYESDKDMSFDSGWLLGIRLMM